MNGQDVRKQREFFGAQSQQESSNKNVKLAQKQGVFLEDIH